MLYRQLSRGAPFQLKLGQQTLWDIETFRNHKVKIREPLGSLGDFVFRISVQTFAPDDFGPHPGHERLKARLGETLRDVEE